ncbi:MAG: hypothetical protein II955_05180 [Clostridia bacterium]|nr:hypothetical protein [Clostridia bacterium]
MERLIPNCSDLEGKKSYSTPTAYFIPLSEEDILKTSIGFAAQSCGDLWEWNDIFPE